MTPEQAHAAFDAETRQGDTYGLAVGHMRLPNGTWLGIAQNDDAMAVALVHAGWDAWMEHLNAEV